MGGLFSRDRLAPELMKQLKVDTGFSPSQIHRLHIRFQHLDTECKGYLTKQDLMHIQQVSSKVKQCLFFDSVM
jgi:Ca2+-binding EF-hand superfamily protein